MSIKKNLLALSLASAVTVGGAPVAFAADATTPTTDTKPAATDTKPAGSSDEQGDKPAGSSDEQKAELKGSIDKTFGWNENTTGLEKFQTIFNFVAKIVKTILGIPSLGSAK